MYWHIGSITLIYDTTYVVLYHVRRLLHVQCAPTTRMHTHKHITHTTDCSIVMLCVRHGAATLLLHKASGEAIQYDNRVWDTAVYVESESSRFTLKTLCVLLTGRQGTSNRMNWRTIKRDTMPNIASIRLYSWLINARSPISSRHMLSPVRFSFRPTTVYSGPPMRPTSTNRWAKHMKSLQIYPIESWPTSL